MHAALVCLPLLFAAALAPCGGRISILSYNVQNLFDGRSDGTEYPEYRPPQWGRGSAEAKLAAIGRAIRHCTSPSGFPGPGRAPDLIALQEVENLAVLLGLRDRHLADLGYRYAVLVPQPGAATQAAVLSRLPVVRTAVHPVGTPGGAPLRHVLEVEIEHQGRRLVVLNNHWKAKTGGVEATAAARRRAAGAVRRRVEEILAANPAADVLVLGDLNENVDEFLEARGRYPTALFPWDSAPPAAAGAAPRNAAQEAEILLCSDSQQTGSGPRGLGLYEPWYELSEERRGSAVYRGRWQTPDHMLLAPGLFDREGFSYRPGSFRVVRLSWLLDAGTGHPLGFSASPGGRGGRGTSDHLPLLLELETP